MDPATSLATDFVLQGISSDLSSTIEGFSRDDADRYAAASHARAVHAWEQGRFARSVVPVKDQSRLTVLTRDGVPRHRHRSWPV